LLPAYKQVGLVGVNQTGSRLAGACLRNVPATEPPAHRARCHSHVSLNVCVLHPLLSQGDDLLVASESLGLTSLLHPLLGLRPGMTVELVGGLRLLGSMSCCRLLCMTQLSETVGELDGDTGSQVLDQMPPIADLPGVWRAFLDS
jgi:hypothetical protein